MSYISVSCKSILVSILAEAYPPMPMMNFISDFFCVIGHLRNSVSKSREPHQTKLSLSQRFKLKPPSPSPSSQMSPPFTTSLIDYLLVAHIKDVAAVSPPAWPIGAAFHRPIVCLLGAGSTNFRGCTVEVSVWKLILKFAPALRGQGREAEHIQGKYRS